ncbi:MAG: Unknown protein [uncultured Campylobacterales bacterium]|uniref:Uncharacterized protein n=1 Tax=uncultured Campylobacterales bacterium TaxID=352960 RepID=A0A6S6THU4_9BACT|nr:MAG: Unknown protein [uncultured Campylobacterales bacterium]
MPFEGINPSSLSLADGSWSFAPFNNTIITNLILLKVLLVIKFNIKPIKLSLLPGLYPYQNLNQST